MLITQAPEPENTHALHTASTCVPEHLRQYSGRCEGWWVYPLSLLVPDPKKTLRSVPGDFENPE
jgi:hypothetical protein